MTRIYVDAEVIAALGRSLQEVGESLATRDDVDVDRAQFGQSASAEAFEHLMLGWRRSRKQLAAAMDELGERAQAAGAAYIAVERLAGQQLGGGVPQ